MTNILVACRKLFRQPRHGTQRTPHALPTHVLPRLPHLRNVTSVGPTVKLGVNSLSPEPVALYVLPN